MSAPAYVMRAAGPADLEGFKQLRARAGAGFTSLMMDDAAMAAKLELSAASFAKPDDTQGPERYFIALEHVESGELAGCCAIKSTIGETPPFFNFRLIREAQFSPIVNRRFDMDVLISVNDFTGQSEVGTLFVRPEHRGPGIGRALAQVRYLLMALAPKRFSERVISELRGVVLPDGVSPFWEALGRYFFHMDFAEADRISANSDNQFILDLMPQHPIYVDLLPESARAVIGKCHSDGEGARRLLEWEGFTFASVIDIFDGGPLMHCPRDQIRTLRDSRRKTIALASDLQTARRGLIAVPRVADFRCVAARIAVEGPAAKVDADTLRALKLEPGADVQIWVEGDAS